MDPVADAGLINTELALADLGVVERKIEKLRVQGKKGKAAGGGTTVDPVRERDILERVFAVLNDGVAARHADLDKDEFEVLSQLGLLTSKPVVYVANVGDSVDEGEGGDEEGERMVADLTAFATEEGSPLVVIAGQAEADLTEFDEDERSEMREQLGIVASAAGNMGSKDAGEGRGNDVRENDGEADGEGQALDTLLRCTMAALNRDTYFTAGKQECRAWMIPKGALAPQAASVIHSDFERGFICAEVVSYADLMKYGNVGAARVAGKVRTEGKEYPVVDGDVCLFRFNV